MDRHSSSSYLMRTDDQQIKRWLGRNAVLSTFLVTGFAIMMVIGSSGTNIKSSKTATTETASRDQSDTFKLRQQTLPLHMQPISLDR